MALTPGWIHNTTYDGASYRADGMTAERDEPCLACLWNE
jgi:hypothetical protein